jgi:hypothetical protein
MRFILPLLACHQFPRPIPSDDGYRAAAACPRLAIGIHYQEIRMAFVFSWDLPDPQSNSYHKRQREQWDDYRRELERIQRKLRPNTREFAMAEWHYDSRDPRCPHDAWLEAVTISERADPADIARRSLQIRVRLLGAYHDGFIELTYVEVESYTLDLPHRRPQSAERHPSHGDWLIDEISFSRHGKIVHEIEWSNGGHWIIECNDIEYRWISNDSQPATDR